MKPFTLYVDAHSNADTMYQPDYIRLEVTPGFVDQVNELSQLCRTHDLKSISVTAGPDAWDMQDELRIYGNSLKVSGDEFWFEGLPKHGDAIVESGRVEIADLCRLMLPDPINPDDFASRSILREGDTVFYASDNNLEGLMLDIETAEGALPGADDTVTP